MKLSRKTLSLTCVGKTESLNGQTGSWLNRKGCYPSSLLVPDCLVRWSHWVANPIHVVTFRCIQNCASNPDTAINIKAVQRPWNPKFNKSHDFIVDVLPELLVDGRSEGFPDFLENGVLNTRKRAKLLCGGRGSCLAKVTELYVRYIGGVSGSSRKLAKQDLNDPTAMIYSGYNSHPLQKGSTDRQICSVEWEIVEACVLFRAQPMLHNSVAPFGILTSAVIENYIFKANFLKDFQMANSL